MRFRRRSAVVPAFALLAVLVALYWLYRDRERAAPPLPEEILLPLPSPPTHTSSAPSAPEPAPRLAPATAVGEEAEESDEQIRKDMQKNLSAVFTAEKAFFAEYHRYSTDFDAIGYQPEGMVLHFKLGFARTFQPEQPKKMDERREQQVSTTEGFVNDPGFHLHFSRAAKAVTFDDNSHFCRSGCSASDSDFELMAISTVGGKTEVWTINQAKELEKQSD
jgi:hypothetical protein